MSTGSKPSLLTVVTIAGIALVALPARPTAQAASQPAPAQPAAARPAAPRPAPKAMTNADVIKMVQGDLGDELVAMAIRKAPRTAFDLSADGLLDLKTKGVSAAILRMMLDPTAKFEPAAPAPPPPPAPTAKPAAAPPPPPSAPAAKPAPADPPTSPLIVSGGSLMSIPKTYNDTWDAVVAYLKKEGQAVEVANSQSGEIITMMTTSGGRTQTGRRVQIALLKQGDWTTVRVAVTVQTRKGASDSWSEPRVDERQSQRAADELKRVLGG